MVRLYAAIREAPSLESKAVGEGLARFNRAAAELGCDVDRGKERGCDPDDERQRPGAADRALKLNRGMAVCARLARREQASSSRDLVRAEIYQAKIGARLSP